MEELGSNSYIQNHHTDFKMSNQTGGSFKKEELDNTSLNNLQVTYNYRSMLESCKKDDRSNAHNKLYINLVRNTIRLV